MTPQELRAWQARMGYTQQQASDALGISRATYNRYLAHGAGRMVALACAAVEAGLREPYKKLA